MGDRSIFSRVGQFWDAVGKFALTAWHHPELAQKFTHCSSIDAEETSAEIERLSRRQNAMIGFRQEFAEFSKLLEGARGVALDQNEAYPCLDDRTSETGFDRHYVYHPAWAARIVARIKPEVHVDISSTLHFATIVSAFVRVAFYDFRPAPLVLPNMSSEPADLTNLHFDSDSVASLSCMHVIEHIGLGRYGDPFDVDGDGKAARELSRVLAKDGHLIVAMPVGRPRIQFNAHRVYSHEQVLDLFSGLRLVEHALIPDGAVESGMVQNPSAELINAQNYGCGCYVFSK
jgi:SAM-dependent methyltransferase